MCLWCLAGGAPDGEREIDPARNNAERTRLDRDFPDGDHAPVVLSGPQLRSSERKVGRRQEGVVAELERRCPAVVGLAQKGTLTVDFPGDALHDSDGHILGLKRFALFDVELELDFELPHLA